MLYGTLEIRVKFSSIQCKKLIFTLTNLLKKTAYEKRWEVLELDLVQIFALFLIRGVALISMNFRLLSCEIEIELCMTKYSYGA